ncbi:MAG: Fis family transcriptional regulator, partial [Deltaproteobacteria bacterium]|nr:Fis family transcriptional regulator [Deltaproteobacteria bacterium]
MAIPFPSKEWTQAFVDAINANPRYREAAKEWRHGQVAYVLHADPRLGLNEDMAILLDLHEGQCRGGAYLSAREAEA